MKITARVYLYLYCTIMFITPGMSSAQQKTLAQLQTEMVSSWLVTVEGEDRTRTLKISGAAQKSEDTLLLDAVYGWTDGNQTPISASLMQSGQEVKLFYTTQPGARVAATQTSSGTFEGTFTLTNGTAKPVKVQKVSEEELQARIATAKAARAAGVIVKPNSNVPELCAAFSGQWTGTWSQGGIGQYWLWVVEIDANCTAKYAYLSHPNPPRGFAKTKIEDGAFIIPNRSTGRIRISV